MTDVKKKSKQEEFCFLPCISESNRRYSQFVAFVLELQRQEEVADGAIGPVQGYKHIY